MQLAGEWDSTAFPFLRERAEAIRAVRPDARIEIVPRAGHWAMYERPAAFEAALRGILAGMP